MPNPYESPVADNDNPSEGDGRSQQHTDLPLFFAWYFGAFIFSTLLWHLSAFVRAIDLLELPMLALHFPLAGFLDPSDWMIRNDAIFVYAVAFWGAVVPVAFRFAVSANRYDCSRVDQRDELPDDRTAREYPNKLKPT